MRPPGREIRNGTGSAVPSAIGTARARFLGRAAVLTLAAVLVAGAATAQEPGILDRTTLTYKQASFTWMDRLHPLAVRSFIPLAGIEFAISGLMWVLNDKEGVDDVAGQFVRKFAVLSFWFTILFGWELWIPTSWTGSGTRG